MPKALHRDGLIMLENGMIGMCTPSGTWVVKLTPSDMIAMAEALLEEASRQGATIAVAFLTDAVPAGSA